MEYELYNEKFKNVHSQLKNHEQRISITETKQVETDKTLAVSINGINASLETLSELPKVISRVSETITKMGGTMELMQIELKRNTESIANLKKDTENKFVEIQKDVKKIDEEGKFNLRVWFGQNFAKIVVSGSALGALIKYLAG